MEIIVKKTHELSDDEIKSIYHLFEEVFEKQRSVFFFREEFENNPIGYSYHAIWYDDDRTVIGHNVYIPFQYVKNDVKFMLALSTDAMIHPKHRGKGGYRQLVMACGEMAQKEGCKMRIGFPNDNSYPVQIRGFKFKDIGSLTTYCLPIHLSGINVKLRFLNFLSVIGSFIVILFSHLSLFSQKTYTVKYKKDRSSFDSFRYKWFSGDYRIIEKNKYKFVYRRFEFKGKKGTFLMDVHPMSKANFDKACRYIYFHEFNTTPFIIYVGHLKFYPLSMIRIPKRCEPKQFHFVGKVFDTDFMDSDVFDIDNWDVNLSNYDLL